MDRAILLLIVNVAVIATAAVLLIYAWPFRRWPSVRYLLVLNAGFIVLAFCTLSVVIHTDFETKVMFSHLRFVGISVMGPAYLLFLSHTAHRWTWIQNRWLKSIVFGFSAVTIFFSIVPAFRDWILTDFEPITSGGMSVLKFKTGPWLRVFMIASYFWVWTFLFLSARVIWTERGLVRKQVSLLTAMVLVIVSVDIFAVTTNSDLRWQMFSSSFYGLNVLPVMYAVFAPGFTNLAAAAKQRIFELLPDPVIIVDRFDTIAGFNAAAREAFAMSSIDIAEAWGERLKHLPNTQGEHVVEVRGRKSVYELTIRDLNLAQGWPQGRLYFYRDLTRQKEVERGMEQLLGFNAELMSLISHDLAGNLSGQARLAERLVNELPEAARAMGVGLKDSAASSRDLVHGLVLWAQLQRPDAVHVSRPFEINALCEDTIEITSSLARVHGVELVLRPLSMAFVLKGDSNLTGSVLRNMISNAIRASQKGQSVEISIENIPGLLKVHVRDEGSGMSAEQITSILSQASRLNGETRFGYGIGLKLGQKFLEKQGGRLEIESQPGQGSRVSLCLPVQV